MKLELYRVKVYDAPIPHGSGALIDYVPMDLPLREATDLAVAAKRQFPKEHFRVVPADAPTTRQAVVHAVATVAKANGIAIPNPARMSSPELRLAGAYVARATNHGNRAPKPSALLDTDGQGRLVIRLGGAR